MSPELLLVAMAGLAAWAGRERRLRRELERRLMREAARDPVTALPNRAFLADWLFFALARVRRESRQAGVLRVLTDGPAGGSELAAAVEREAALRLQTLCRDCDLVACLGEGEFALVVDQMGDESELAMLGQRIVAALVRPFPAWKEPSGETRTPEVRVGIAVFPLDGDDPATLLAVAGAALQRSGTEPFRVAFGRERSDQRAGRLEVLRRDVHWAMEREQLELDYQPQVKAEGGMLRMRAVEALLRWRHPDLGVVLPGEFLPLVEHGGLVVPVGAWVLRAACEQLAAWRHAGLPELRVVVNISSLQLTAHEGFPLYVDRLLASCGLPPEALELDLSERVLTLEAATESLERLGVLGVGLTLEHFGTGWFSLASLRRFPGRTLKVDRSLLRGLPDGQGVLCRAVRGVAAELGMSLAAAGVESREQATFLAGLDCRILQGRLFGLPQPAGDIPGWQLDMGVGVQPA